MKLCSVSEGLVRGCIKRAVIEGGCLGTAPRSSLFHTNSFLGGTRLGRMRRERTRSACSTPASHFSFAFYEESAVVFDGPRPHSDVSFGHADVKSVNLGIMVLMMMIRCLYSLYFRACTLSVPVCLRLQLFLCTDLNMIPSVTNRVLVSGGN